MRTKRYPELGREEVAAKARDDIGMTERAEDVDPAGDLVLYAFVQGGPRDLHHLRRI